MIFLFFLTAWILPAGILLYSEYTFLFFPEDPLPPLSFWLLRSFGTLLYFSFVAEIILGSRPHFLEKILGLPALLRCHIIFASVSLILLFAHGISRILTANWRSFSGLLGLSVGIIVLLLVIVAVVKWIPTPFSAGKPGDYHSLRRLHNLFIPLMVLSAWHIAASGSHYYHGDGFSDYNYLGNGIVIGYGLIALYFYIQNKFFREIKARKDPFTITRVQRPASNIIVISGQSRHRLQYKAGQFGFFSFNGEEEHPFSYSSSPGEENLEIIVKATGDYTEKMCAEFSPGVTFAHTGPYGQFVISREDEKEHIFVAGGIGITPFISILKDCVQKEVMLNGKLIWICRDEKDFVFTDELNVITDKWNGFRLLCLRYSRNMALDPEVFKPVNAENCHIMICASAGLTKSIERISCNWGIRKKDITHELFSF